MLNKANNARLLGIINCIIFLGISYFYSLDKISNNLFGLITICLMTITIVIDVYIFYHDKNRDSKVMFVAHIILLIWIIYIVTIRW